MGDDFGALELDTELDDDMRALFGESQAVAGPSMPGTQALPARSLHVLSVPRCPSTTSQLPRGGQSLACITNKRPAIELNQSWPHKARVLTQTPHAWHDDTAYDDLDLEASAPASSAVSGTFSSNNRQNSTFEASRKDLPAINTGVCNVMPNFASQATELWHSAYSQRPVQASAASALLQSASDLRQPSLSQQSVAVTSAGRQALPGSANINSRTALEGLCLPGPAGALQRVQAAGLQMPRMADLDLQTQSAQTASQQQLHQQMHPDFVSSAWQSAMEALDLLCFSETSPLLQHHVKKVNLCQSSCKLPKMVLLVESLKYTGCGDAFAQLKDPTGSIGAGVHANVFQVEEGVSPGAVLMLDQVPLLVLSKAMRYLCVTAENVVQVIKCY